MPVFRDRFSDYCLTVQTDLEALKMKLLLHVTLGAVSFLAVWPVTHGQVFGGVSETGAVVLSNFQSTDSNTLVVAAPLAHIPVVEEAARTPAPRQPYVSDPKIFLPFLAEASKISRLPVELIHAVIVVESNYNPRAISPKGARGLMQIMPATARRFLGGDALDPRQNILTGSRYLRWLLDRFNQNTELAVAAYNAGEGAIVKAGNRVPRNAETLKYVPKVLDIYQRASTGLPDNKVQLLE